MMRLCRQADPDGYSDCLQLIGRRIGLDRVGPQGNEPHIVRCVSQSRVDTIQGLCSTGLPLPALILKRGTEHRAGGRVDALKVLIRDRKFEPLSSCALSSSAKQYSKTCAILPKNTVAVRCIPSRQIFAPARRLGADPASVGTVIAIAARKPKLATAHSARAHRHRHQSIEEAIRWG